MDCEHYLTLYSARLDGELSPEEARELDAHLALCPDCRRAAGELEQVHLALCALGEVSVPGDFSEKTMERVRRHVRDSRIRRFVRQAAGLAACLLLCIGIYRLTGTKKEDGAAEASFRSVQGVAGLSDGNDALIAASVPPADAEAPGGEIGSDLEAQGADPLSGPELPKTAAVPERQDQDPPAPAPSHYAFANVQNFKLCQTTAADAAPTAQILGSTQALKEFAGQYPEEELLELSANYDAEFFRTRRLLAIVADGSEPPQLEIQGLFREMVVLDRSETDGETEETSVWIIVAEVDTMFDDGDALSVSFSD